MTLTAHPDASIVIPYYGRADLVHARLVDIYRFIPANVEVILVDDCSTEPDCQMIVGHWQKKMKARHDIRYRRNGENMGFPGACNVGAKLAHSDLIVILSNDVIISGDFITPLWKKVNEHPNALFGGRLLYHDTGWNVFNFDGKDTIVPYLEGWLIACKKLIWKDLGGFDENFKPYDYEDLDLSLNASLKGYELVPLDSPYLQHMSGATISKVNPNRQSITVRNREYFYNKWKPIIAEKESNLIPSEVVHA